MKSTTEQIADEIAGKCANQIHSQYSDEWFTTLAQENKNSEHYKEYVELHRTASAERQRIAAWIIHQGSLLGFIEVARAAKRKQEVDLDEFDFMPKEQIKELLEADKQLSEALDNLQTKVEL